MNDLKEQILQVLENNTIEEQSSTGTTGERIIYAPHHDLAESIIELVLQNFEPKKCIPEGINSKEDHEEYLKAIGHEKYVKDLELHKEETVGLYAFDQDLDTIFENIPNQEGCKTALEAYFVQQVDYLKSIVFQID